MANIEKAARNLVARYPQATVRADVTVPATKLQTVALTDLSPGLRALVQRAGYTSLYPHQLETWKRARQGESVALAAPTAFGKTLSYTLPVCEALLSDPNATALYIAPSKALAQQQHARFTKFAPTIPADLYDGDTPKEARASVRARARFLLTNPDMLHVSIVAYHRGWRRFFTNLRYIVVDESHQYSGALGSHTALVLRRLNHVAALYGSHPTYIALSATIANPDAHASDLFGVPVNLVEGPSGWRGDRRFILWEPPEGDVRGGPADVFATLVASGLKTLLFARTRQGAEQTRLAIGDALWRMNRGELSSKVASYRSGYSALERRKIEQALFSGQLAGVVATNALELGIDVGSLDAVVLSIPGSLASFWQQAGRAGRGLDPSLVVTILRDDPIDAYYAAEPDKLLGGKAERATINAQNPVVLRAHLPAAAFENTLVGSNLSTWGDNAPLAVAELVAQGALVRSGDWYLPKSATSSPAYAVPIRGIGDRSSIISKGQTIEEIDTFHAFRECFPGAIYLIQGKRYVISEADAVAHTIAAEELPPGDERASTQVQIETRITPSPHMTLLSPRIRYGPLQVALDTRMYRVLDRRKNPISAWQALSTPPLPLDTEGMQIVLSDEGKEPFLLHSGVHAAEHLLVNALPTVCTADRRDVGSVTNSGGGRHIITLFDLVPGGLGIVREALTSLVELAGAAIRLLSCPCEDGCPRCTYLASCPNIDLNKEGALAALAVLMEVVRQIPVRDLVV